jgi:hypothetical protein
MALTLERESPHPAVWQKPETETLARHPLVTDTIKYFLGHGRSFPPEILDEELVWQIFEVAKSVGSIQAGMLYREHTPRELRAQCRAVLMNLSRMRRENGGKLPWGV